MNFTEDAAALFADFGKPVTIGGASKIGIFDEPNFDPLNIGGSKPALTVTSADGAVALGTAVVANGANYTVVEVVPDGTGFSRLLLQEA
jgi:hypothetical protein